MALPPLCGLKMRNLLLGFTLTLLAVVQSSPLSAVTQIPAKAENDVFEEARNDGYLVRHVRSTLLATESLKTNSTTQSSQQPTDHSETSDASTTEEASGNGVATMAMVPNFMALTVPTIDKPLFIIDSTQSATHSSLAPDHSSVPQTTQLSQQPTEHNDVQTPLDERKTSNESVTEEASSDNAVTMATVPDFIVLTVPTSDKPLFIVDATQSVTHSSLTPDHRSVPETIQATDFSSSTEGNITGSGDGWTQSDTETYTRTNSASNTEAPLVSKIARNTVFGFNTESNISGSGDGWTQSDTETYTRTNSASNTEAPLVSKIARNTVFGFNTESNISGSGDGWSQDVTETYSRTNSSSNAKAPSTSEATHNTRSFPIGSKNSNELGSSVLLNNSVFEDTVKNDQNDQNDQITPVTANPPQKVVEDVYDPEPVNAGHQTPDWIIILGFLVGLAVLVLLCVAVATRDKWNRPNRVPQPEAQANSSNKQAEFELEELMHKEDKPRENGKLSEYVIIPLDELPENGSSH